LHLLFLFQAFRELRKGKEDDVRKRKRPFSEEGNEANKQQREELVGKRRSCEKKRGQSARTL